MNGSKFYIYKRYGTEHNPSSPPKAGEDKAKFPNAHFAVYVKNITVSALVAFSI